MILYLPPGCLSQLENIPAYIFFSYRAVTQQWHRHLLSGHIVVHPWTFHPLLYLWWSWFSRSVKSDACDPVGCIPQAALSLRFPRQDGGGGLPLALPCFIFSRPQGRIALQLCTKVRIILSIWSHTQLTVIWHDSITFDNTSVYSPS